MEGDTLLHTAIRSTSVNLVKSLLERLDQDIWIRENSEGVTPLEEAVKIENETIAMEMVEMILGRMKKKEAESVGERLLEICKRFM